MRKFESSGAVFAKIDHREVDSIQDIKESFIGLAKKASILKEQTNVLTGKIQKLKNETITIMEKVVLQGDEGNRNTWNLLEKFLTFKELTHDQVYWDEKIQGVTEHGRDDSGILQEIISDVFKQNVADDVGSKIRVLLSNKEDVSTEYSIRLDDKTIGKVVIHSYREWVKTEGGEEVEEHERRKDEFKIFYDELDEVEFFRLIVENCGKRLKRGLTGVERARLIEAGIAKISREQAEEK
jgi:hypothetical protein